MIAISHNLRASIGRLARFESNLKQVPTQSTDPEFWLPIARREAESVLHVIADRTVHYLIPEFVNTITVLAFGDPETAGMLWTMERVRDVAIKITSLSPEQRQQIWDNRRDIIDRQTVEDWVAQEKTKTAIDAGLTDDQITDRLLAILMGPADPQRESAAWSLLFGRTLTHQHHLLEFQNRLVDKVLPPEEIGRWLGAVLVAWREIIADRLPTLMRENIRQAWRDSK